MTWIELSTHATNEAIDWIRTLLAPLDYIQSINVVSNSDLSKSFNEILEKLLEVKIYLLDNNQSYSRVEQIKQLLSSLQRTGMITELETAIAHNISSSDAALPINRVGQFVILPLHSTYQPQTFQEIVLNVEQSAAFGSGLHPATILSLTLLERYIKPEMNILDLGCGSGILSVAMAKLGATVTAIDNDPVAVAATQVTVQENQVTDQVTVLSGSLGTGTNLGHWMGGDLISENQQLQPAAKFDLIVANIFARIHLRLVDDYRNALHQSCDRSALLITAGYDTDYEDEINQTFVQAGFYQCDRAQQEDWVALVHQLNGH